MVDADIKSMFAAYGNIKSLVLLKNNIGRYGFVCYDDPNGAIQNYGAECCSKAIEGLNGKDMGSELKLHVSLAIKKSDKEGQKQRDRRNEDHGGANARDDGDERPRTG